MSTIDLRQFHATFFAESFDGLASMEANLLRLEQGERERELLDTIFRAIHSIKGSSGTFGFSEIAHFTHVLETLLDEIRKGLREPDSHLIDILLESVDCVRHLLLSAERETPIDAARITEVENKIGTLALADTALPGSVKTVAPASTEKHFHIRFYPTKNFFIGGNDPISLFRMLETMGDLKTQIDLSRLPPFDALDPEHCYFAWQLDLISEASREQIEEVFDWVIDECELSLDEITSATPIVAPIEEHRHAERRQLDRDHAEVSTTSIHVSTGKVDRLINMVGELVITQSILNQIGNHFDMSKLPMLLNDLAQLERNTRELQESVMSIRMVPISQVFNRYSRIVRDTSLQLGKKVELKISGEQCELDRSLIEKIVDPFAHLIRNSIDHGIETPELRKRQGKPEHGTIHLHAEHCSGSVVITISDDGQGLDHDKIRAKAVERGLLDAQTPMSNDQLEQMIFLPGFSTAASITDVSGRGVGLDVVRSNIQSIGGKVDVRSIVGGGTQFTLRFPLTLAILDGLLLSVGEEVFILPLTQIIESLRPAAEDIKTIADACRVLQIRDEYLPILALHQLFAVPGAVSDPTQGILVLLEAEGTRFALLVDDLVGQQQVVMKSLETNYHRVEGMLGATILGTGKVALILDVAALRRLIKSGGSRHWLKENTMERFGKAIVDSANIARQEFLTFTLGHEEFGLEILKVQEIRSYDGITKIPNAPDFLQGVINLRGVIVPIVDMRMKFNLQKTEYNEFTVVIVLNLSGRTMGVVVDTVSDVIALSQEEIKPAPEFSKMFSTEYLLGLAAVEQRMVILVDIERLMTHQELAVLDDVPMQTKEVEHV
jgi:two-component system chemotaxis sensor kinase CheA